MAIVGQCKNNPVTGVSGDIYTSWTNNADANLLGAATQQGSQVRNMLAAQIEAVAAGIISAAGAGSQFHFRLDPTVTSQFGTPRQASGSAPSVTAMTASSGRKFIRFTAGTVGACFIPLLSGGSPLALTGRFRIEVWAKWNGVGGSQYAGIQFNAHPSTGFTGYAVTSNGASPIAFDSVVSGTAENQTTPNRHTTDSAVDFAPLFVDVWLDTSTGYCHYSYGSSPYSHDNFKQRRFTTLATAGQSAVGLYSIGNSASLDIAELVIWKNERDW